MRDESDDSRMIEQTYKCDGCGNPVDAGAAHRYAGILQGQATVAAGGAHHWHSCSAKCAAAYLRHVADGIEAREMQLRAAREAELRAAGIRK